MNKYISLLLTLLPPIGLKAVYEIFTLRIDNSRHSVICTFGLTSGTMSCTLTYHMSKNRAHFSLFDVNDIFARFHFIQILV